MAPGEVVLGGKKRDEKSHETVPLKEFSSKNWSAESYITQ
jgi:hypothetical protein